MRNALFVTTLTAMLLVGCGAGTTFAPGLQETPRLEPQSPLSDSVDNQSTDDESISAQPSSHESPIRAGCLEIHHSGRWRIATPEESAAMDMSIEEISQSHGESVHIMTDQGWSIVVSRLLAGRSVVEELVSARAGLEQLVGLMSVMGAVSLIISEPELFETIPSEEQQMDLAIRMVIERISPHISEVNIPESTVDAASLSLSLDGQTMVFFGQRITQDNPNSAVIVMGTWPTNVNSPVPLMDLTEIIHRLRIVEGSE